MPKQTLAEARAALRDELEAKLAELARQEEADAADKVRHPHGDVLAAMADHKLDVSKLAVVLSDLLDKAYPAPADEAEQAPANDEDEED